MLISFIWDFVFFLTILPIQEATVLCLHLTHVTGFLGMALPVRLSGNVLSFPLCLRPTYLLPLFSIPPPITSKLGLAFSLLLVLSAALHSILMIFRPARKPNFSLWALQLLWPLLILTVVSSSDSQSWLLTRSDLKNFWIQMPGSTQPNKIQNSGSGAWVIVMGSWTWDLVV